MKIRVQQTSEICVEIKDHTYTNHINLLMLGPDYTLFSSYNDGLSSRDTPVGPYPWPSKIEILKSQDISLQNSDCFLLTVLFVKII